MSELPSSFETQLAEIDSLDLTAAFKVRGAVVEVGDGVARVSGLDDVGYEELVTFDSGGRGMAYELAPEYTGVVLLSEADGVSTGDAATATGRLPSVPASRELLGRLIDPPAAADRSDGDRRGDSDRPGPAPAHRR